MRPLDLPPITLEEMQARAALLTRVDRKYLLRSNHASAVLDRLDPGCRVLEIAGRRSSGYASIYFDTPDRQSFHSTATARRRRWKVRTRTYLDTGEQWLEVKTRGPRGRTVKERLPLRSDPGDRLPEEAVTFVDQRLRAARAIDRPWRARPALHTAYDRSTVLLSDGTSRATIDTNLRWALPDGTHLDTDGLVVLETKTAGSASALDRLLWSLGHRPTRLSKFGTGLALLEPSLPANRWHRHLTGDGPLTTPST